MQTQNVIAGGVAGAIASLGIYRLLASALLWLFGKSIRLRALILGKGFLEGTWVGHYMHGDQHRFTIEYIDQSSGNTVIHGREFDQAGNTRASWSSDTVSIDTVRMQLVYAYTCKVFRRKHVQEGLGVFAMVRESDDKAATKLDGYAVDLIDGDRDPNTEYKIDNKPVTDEYALTKGRERFNVPVQQPNSSIERKSQGLRACVAPHAGVSRKSIKFLVTQKGEPMPCYELIDGQLREIQDPVPGEEGQDFAEAISAAGYLLQTSGTPCNRDNQGSEVNIYVYKHSDAKNPRYYIDVCGSDRQYTSLVAADFPALVRTLREIEPLTAVISLEQQAWNSFDVVQATRRGPEDR